MTLNEIKYIENMAKQILDENNFSKDVERECADLDSSIQDTVEINKVYMKYLRKIYNKFKDKYFKLLYADKEDEASIVKLDMDKVYSVINYFENQNKKFEQNK